MRLPVDAADHATADSIQHAAHKINLKVESEWLPTPSLTAPGAEKVLEKFDGLWASPGSPYKSFDGMLAGIEFARRRDWPFLGTCGGFQYALIEFARASSSPATSIARVAGMTSQAQFPIWFPMLFNNGASLSISRRMYASKSRSPMLRGAIP